MDLAHYRTAQGNVINFKTGPRNASDISCIPDSMNIMTDSINASKETNANEAFDMNNQA